MKTKVVYNLFKKASGIPQIYRPTFEWFSREEILGGKNRRWNELLKLNPSLGPASDEFTIVFYNSKMKQFQDRFNLEENKIREFFKVYVGYHPNFGLYLCSVGPYTGQKIEDSMNKFGYFTHKLISLDADSIRSSLNGMLSDESSVFPQIAEELRVGDGKKNKSQLQKTRNKKTWDMNFSRLGLWNYLDETDFYISTANSLGQPMEYIDITPEYLAKYDLELLSMRGEPIPYTPVIGRKSTLKLKPKGALKLIMAYAERGGRASIAETQEMIEDLAYSEDIEVENLKDNLINNNDFIRRVCEAYSNKNPLFKDVFEAKNFGTQIPDPLVPNKQMIDSLKLKEEVISIILNNKTNDPNKIALILNSTRKGDVFNREIVQNIIEEINDLYSDNYEDALNNLQEDLDQSQSERGFDDFESALKMASVRLAEQEVDPFTRAKLKNPKNVFKDLFEKTEGVVNYKSEDLTVLRNGGILEEKRGIDEESLENEKEEIEIIEEQDEFKSINVNKKPVKTKPLPPIEEVEEEDTEEEKEILALKIKTIERISSNLRKSGNIVLANKLNTLIKKYKS